jgi:carboxylesterase type B
LQSGDALGGKLEGEKMVWFDEEKCLNVTVSVPKELLERKDGKGLPVLVHVHGGGFVEGSHTQGVRGMFSTFFHPISIVETEFFGQ